MPAGDESSIIEEYLFGTLSNDVTLTALLAEAAGSIFPYIAKEGSLYPLIIIQGISGMDFTTMNGIRIWNNALYDVKVYGQKGGYHDEISPIFKRVDTLLNRGSGNTSGGKVIACMREQIINLIDNEYGESYPVRIGRYRIQAQAT